MLVRWIRLVFSTNDVMVSCLGLSILLSCSLHFSLVRSLICSDELYGNPNVDDCEQALLEIPFAKQTHSSYSSRCPHIFAEPQFQQPPFRLVTNDHRPQAIIQLPKIWKHSESYSQKSTFTIANLRSIVAEHRFQTPAV